MTNATTKSWYLARKPIPKANPHAISIFFWFVRIQEKNSIKQSEKKKVSIVSSIAVLDSQKKPGVAPKMMLATRAVLGPYVRFENSNNIQIERSEKITAVNRPVIAVGPKILKNPAVNMSYAGG